MPMPEPALSTPPSSSPRPFVHLRLHTDYSIRDGLVPIAPLVEQLRDLQMPAVAVTDQANLFALIKFYRAAMQAGIKPLCGCDLPVQSRASQSSRDSRGSQASPQEQPTRLLLLVKDQQGYQNLTRLISDLYTGWQGRSQPPVLDKAALAERGAGLIALSGAQFSDVGRALLAGEMGKARQLLDSWRGLFPEGYYLELQRVGRAEEEDYIAAALTLASEAGCPVVASNDVRFLTAEDFAAHEARVCINDSRVLSDPRRPRIYTEQQYLRSGEEMAELFADIPQSLDNAVQIARRCNLELKLGQPSLPNYPLPDGMSPEQYLSRLAAEGLERRLQAQPSSAATAPAPVPATATTPAASAEVYEQRLQQELQMINQMGFAGYFLVVWEFIQWARDNDIPVGPGRGSGAGSLVAYALRITDLDPLRYGLLFERFLNPERVSMPDLDIDFCIDGRDRVIEHVTEQYGEEAVAKIITFGTMAARAVVRDVARVQGKSYGVGDKLAKLIPGTPGMTLKQAMAEVKDLSEHVANDAEAEEVMDMAYKLEGVVRQMGTHAGGVVIARTRLTDFTPLCCDDSGGGPLTQFDKDDVETAGLVKFDFLGLRTLTVIDRAVKMINRINKQHGDAPVVIEQLPLDDKVVYDLLQKGETTAVFQLESDGMKKLLKRLVPSSFDDIIALVALYRPGPLESGMVEDYIERKHGRATVDYPHELLKPVLANTYGVILYQEQVMQIAQVLADYSLGGADILRKAMGKKIRAEMAKQRDTFMAGAQAKGIKEGQATRIFDLMEKFAGYGFNKSHSAAYALVAYQTAWLKARHPAFFMAAMLSSEKDSTDKIVPLIDECHHMGLEILPPDVNTGEFDFTVDSAGRIVYGLGAIRGLGEGPVEAILQQRAEGPFSSLLDLCQRVNDKQQINKSTLEALIKAGALDSLIADDTNRVAESGLARNIDSTRARLDAMMVDAVRAAEQQSHNQAAGLDDMFGDIAPADDLPAAKQSRQVQPWSEKQRLKGERESLGLYLSGHPLDEYRAELTGLVRKRLADVQPDQSRVQTVAGLVYDIRIRRNKSGGSMAVLILDDGSGRLELTLFNKERERYQEFLQKDTILLVECNISHDDYSGGNRGRVQHLQTLQQLRRARAQSIVLLLDGAELPDDYCSRLKAILSPYRCKARGEGCPVEVRLLLNEAKGRIMLGDEWQVLAEEDLMQNLKAEYGRQRVRVKYAPAASRSERTAKNGKRAARMAA